MEGCYRGVRGGEDGEEGETGRERGSAHKHGRAYDASHVTNETPFCSSRRSSRPGSRRDLGCVDREGWDRGEGEGGGEQRMKEGGGGEGSEELVTWLKGFYSIIQYGVASLRPLNLKTFHLLMVNKPLSQC